ncbi:hypothetical protein A0J61_02705 [Choanephora cucurbitarum]|uniref:Uncharacterized protein n=1 Tax=Choanephora cucurbitarum TaxID=101091 RepID=A0A1C7NJS0_9FUNG|nr:hypothetical protein A0J61_02705 [Choanephora cucurbitarum]
MTACLCSYVVNCGILASLSFFNRMLSTSLPLPIHSLSPDTELCAHFRRYWQDQFKRQMAKQASLGRSVLLHACCLYTFILYLPMKTTARSRLVCWRLGLFAKPL